MEEMFEKIQSWGWDWVVFKCSKGEYSIKVGMKKWFTSNLAQTQVLPTGRGVSFDEAWVDLLSTYGEQAEVL